MGTRTGTPATLSAVYRPGALEEKGQADFFAAGTLPHELERAIESYITKKVGKDWDDPVVLERLRNAIVAQKDDYWKPPHKKRLSYAKGYSVLGYLAYHFPVYFMQSEHHLSMLARDGLLKKRMTILDAGTGPGVFPLAIADFYSRLDGATAIVHSVERSEEHIEAFLYLRDRLVPEGGKISLKPPKKADITEADADSMPEDIDLLVFSNVLNELTGLTIEQRAGIVMQLAENLAADGSILIAEPAEEVTSTSLRRISILLKKRGLSIHSPCTFLHGTNCTPDRCWSFVTAHPIRPTRLMQALASGDEPYRYLNMDIKYSYAVLRKDAMTREAFRVSAGKKSLRLSGLGRFVGRRVTVIAAKMSGDLGDEKTRVFRLCDGSAMVPVYAVLPSYHITPGNRELISAPYGSIVDIHDVLVRYNRAHDAYNLLVSKNSVIARKP